MKHNRAGDHTPRVTTTIKLLTWNVLGLREGARVARVVRDARADVVCLQECPRWPGGRTALRIFARATGLRLAAGGGRRGVAVLVAPHVVVEHGEVEAMPRRRTRFWWTYPRATASALVRVGETRLRVASAHLDVWEPGRLEHARLLRSGVERAEVCSVVAGDLNEAPDGAVWSLLTQALVDTGAGGAPTYPATADRRPTKRLDAVLASPGITVVGYRTGQDRLGLPSDHLPVLVTLALPADGAAG